jgi:hypothetical protein|tara:strand:+ start:437 stop:589 length:153 start_codon:yes stop_codon:yes gene_type:complete
LNPFLRLCLNFLQKLLRDFSVGVNNLEDSEWNWGVRSLNILDLLWRETFR